MEKIDHHHQNRHHHKGAIQYIMVYNDDDDENQYFYLVVLFSQRTQNIQLYVNNTWAMFCTGSTIYCDGLLVFLLSF